MRPLRAIVLAAGQGTRMRSRLPKVLHQLCGRPLLWYPVTQLQRAEVTDVVIVASPPLSKHPAFAAFSAMEHVIQSEPKGSADAVRIALDAMPRHDDGLIIVINGDMPLIEAGLVLEMHRLAVEGAQAVLASAHLHPSVNFGRIVREPDGRVARIVEAKDCTPEQRRITEMNIGVYLFDEALLRRVLPQIGCVNAQGEYYLTDAVELAIARSAPTEVVTVPDPVMAFGVNDRRELAQATAAMNRHLAEFWMQNGVTIVDPTRVSLEPELDIGQDTIIQPGVSIGGRSRIGTDCLIGPGTRLDAAVLGNRVRVTESVIVESEVGNDCVIGPFAHIRMGAQLQSDVRIGNFVELKHSVVHEGVRAGHLSYLGDATVGRGANIGAGTITCNYDGERKYETEIGENAFIGSNTSLIAPVKVGDGALTGAGSVVTRDVPSGMRVVGNPARPLTSPANR